MFLTKEANKLRIEYETPADGVTIVNLVGELGMASARALQEVFNRILESGVCRVIVDLKETSYIASSGIGILIAMTENFREKGGNVVLANASSKILHVFMLMGLLKMMRFAASVQDAHKAFQRV